MWRLADIYSEWIKALIYILDAGPNDAAQNG